MGCCYSFYLNQQLKKQTSEIPLFDFKGQTHSVKVVDVYDGDTCQVILRFNKGWYKFKVRSLGYDTPEIKPLKNVANREKLIKMAIDSRNYFISRLTNISIKPNSTKKEIKELLDANTKLVTMKCHGWDKYGRILVYIYSKKRDKKSFNQILLDEGLAYAYDGSKKRNFDEWSVL